jgi:cold shock CspA family protein
MHYNQGKLTYICNDWAGGAGMQVPPEISLKGFVMNLEIDTLLQRQIARLERVCDYIISLRVAIEKEQGRHQLGNPYRVRLDIRVPPNHEIVVKRQTVLHEDVRTPPEPETEPEMINKQAVLSRRKDEPLVVTIRSTFDSARRQLEKLVERQRKEVKTHPQNEIMGFIEKLFRDDEYGFIRSLEGQEIYFHKNSSLHGEWERLEVGTGVRYTEEQGEKGLQASSIEIVNKPGVHEMHQEMHDLPTVARSRKLSRSGR